MNTSSPANVILISSTGLYPFHKNAPARLFKSIGEELANLGLSITYVCLSPACQDKSVKEIDWEEVFENSSVNVWHMGKKKNFFFRRMQEIAVCLQAIKRSKRGTIFVFNSVPYSFLSLLPVVGRLIGVKTVFIAHGGLFVENSNRFVFKMMRYNLSVISFAIDGVISVSHAFGEYLTSFFPNTPIHTVHNGLECSEGFDYSLTCLDKRGKYFNIFYMGRLEEVKGLKTLLYSFQQLYEIHKECRLIIAGSGKIENSLKRLARDLRIEGATSFLGFIDKNDKREYFNKADLFVVPSEYFETFGMVILEAMCFKVPVVASRVGGIPEVIIDGETGVLFESGSKDDLFQKIIELYLDEHKREELAQAAYERLMDKFNTKKMGIEYFKIINMLTSNCR